MAKNGLSSNEINVGGSVFWILLYSIGIVSLIFLLVQAYIQQSLIVAIVALIFTVMLIAGASMSRFKVFDLAGWGDNTLSFTIGFFLYIIIGVMGQQFSIIEEYTSIGVNFLFASVSATLPQLTDVIVNAFLVPIAEEMVWMIGIPFVMITFMNKLGNKYPIWKKDWLQILMLIIVGSITFALFHQGKLILVFIIASLGFRAFLLLGVYGDKKANLIKGVNLTAGFAVGAHMANNLVFRGVENVWLILTTQGNFFPVGFLVVLFFATMFISAIERVLRMINKKNDNPDKAKVFLK